MSFVFHQKFFNSNASNTALQDLYTKVKNDYMLLFPKIFTQEFWITGARTLKEPRPWLIYRCHTYAAVQCVQLLGKAFDETGTAGWSLQST